MLARRSRWPFQIWVTPVNVVEPASSNSHRLWHLPATLGNGGLLTTGDNVRSTMPFAARDQHVALVSDAPRKTTSQADVMADQDLRDHQQDDADDVERVCDLWPALAATWRGEGW
jgi:hypothetical protein